MTVNLTKVPMMRRNKPIPCNELTWAVLPGGTHENTVEVTFANNLVGEFVSPEAKERTMLSQLPFEIPALVPAVCSLLPVTQHCIFFTIDIWCHSSLHITEKPSFLVQCCLMSEGCSSYFLVSDFTDWMWHYFKSIWQLWRGFIECIKEIHPPSLNMVPGVRPFVNNYCRVWVTILQHGGLIYDIVNAVGFLKKIDYASGLFLSILLMFILVFFTVGCPHFRK